VQVIIRSHRVESVWLDMLVLRQQCGCIAGTIVVGDMVRKGTATKRGEQKRRNQGGVDPVGVWSNAAMLARRELAGGIDRRRQASPCALAFGGGLLVDGRECFERLLDFFALHGPGLA
jgi:hypothetical protein